MGGMTTLMGMRGLNPDRGRLLITTSGVALAMVLMIVQLGLIAGFSRMISGPLDHAKADLWIVPQGTDAFDDASQLKTAARYVALRKADVAGVDPVVVGFAAWRTPEGDPGTVIVIGADPQNSVLPPWNLVAGSARALLQPGAVAVDRTYAGQLGISRLGEAAAIEGHRVVAVAQTSGIRSFTTSPYVFTSLAEARRLLEMPASQATYLAVRLRPGADAVKIRDALAAALPRLEVLTPGQFRNRNLARWLLDTGAGAALLLGAVLGFSIGAFIVAQTIHSSIRDNRRQLATLRAMGASGRFLWLSILSHAALITGLAGAIAIAAAAGISWLGANGTLPVSLPPGLIAGLLGLVVVMCLSAAFAAHVRVSRIQPATLLAQ